MAMVAATGLRVSEFLALRWRHVLWDENKISIEQVFRRGKILKRTKTKASKAPVPMCEALAKTLSEFRQQTEYSKDEDLVFASPTLVGIRPLWGQTMNADFVKPAAVALGLVSEGERFGWHRFRHSLSTWANGRKTSRLARRCFVMPSQIPLRFTRSGTSGKRLTPSACTWSNYCG
jgi:integrase